MDSPKSRFPSVLRHKPLKAKKRVVPTVGPVPPQAPATPAPPGIALKKTKKGEAVLRIAQKYFTRIEDEGGLRLAKQAALVNLNTTEAKIDGRVRKAEAPKEVAPADEDDEPEADDDDWKDGNWKDGN